jgi:hypothetical protein
MDQRVLNRLRTSLKEMKGGYRRWRADAEERATTWRWATGPYFAFVPLQNERLESPRGRLLQTQPKSLKKMFAFGFDGNGRLVIVREHDSMGRVEADELASYTKAEGTVRVFVDGGKSVGKVSLVRHVSGKVREMFALGSQGNHRHEKYTYDQDRLTAIDVEQYEADVKESYRQRLELTYKGKAGRVFLVDENGREALFSFKTD